MPWLMDTKKPYWSDEKGFFVGRIRLLCRTNKAFIQAFPMSLWMVMCGMKEAKSCSPVDLAFHNRVSIFTGQTIGVVKPHKIPLVELGSNFFFCLLTEFY